jgi:hypothetical protein
MNYYWNIEQNLKIGDINNRKSYYTYPTYLFNEGLFVLLFNAPFDQLTPHLIV